MKEYYELMYIIPSKYTESEIAEVMKKVEAMVKKHGGEVKRHEDAGKLKLAYPIKRVRYGNYVLVEFEAEKETPKAIEKDLRLALTNEVLRSMVLKMPAITRGKPLQLSSYVAPLQEEEAPEGERKAAAPVAAPAAAPAISSAELDKKIDAALTNDGAKV